MNRNTRGINKDDFGVVKAAVAEGFSHFTLDAGIRLQADCPPNEIPSPPTIAFRNPTRKTRET